MVVHSHDRQQAKRERRENAISFAVALVAGIVVMLLKAPDKWLSAVFITGVVFSGMISFYRRQWSSGRFWAVIVCSFLLHLGLMWVIFGLLLRGRVDVPLLICVPGIFVECFFIYRSVEYLVVRKSSQLESTAATPNVT